MDYFSQGGRRRVNSASQARPMLSGAGSRESMRQNSSIRIRRLPSSNSLRPGSQASNGVQTEQHDFANPDMASRRRSFSAPQRPAANSLPEPDLSRQYTADPHMPSIVEGQSTSAQQAGGNNPYSDDIEDSRPQAPVNVQTPAADSEAGNAQALNSAANAARSNRGLRRFRSGALPPRQELQSDSEYGNDVVSLLDLIDPEVQTLGTLTNMQNSLFVPDLGRLINRRPTYDLSKRPGTGMSIATNDTANRVVRPRAGTRASQAPSIAGIQEKAAEEGPQDMREGIEFQPATEETRRYSINSQLTESHFAVLPHGVTLEGWSDEDIAELNDHVRHLLHSRREGFKRGMRGFGQYVRKPLGLFVTVYATLVTLFGAAWVFMLIGWIYVGDRQSYTINVIDNVLVALFALIGDGLAPFRAVDTYHMCFIAHYHHLTWRLRKEKHMPDLPDHNDLPGRRSSAVDRGELQLDLEAGSDENKDDLEDKAAVTVLTPLQQRRLQYHQAKFNKSHTFYKPHETATHHAFPLRLLVAVVVLLDFHSLFQVALGTCTWSINYKVRPEALTATILSCSITCNIVAGVLISIGDKRTRKKEVMERIFRQDLTKEAIRRVQKHHMRENEQEPAVAIDDDAILGDARGLTIASDADDGHDAKEPRALGKKSLDVPRGKKSLDVPRKSIQDKHRPSHHAKKSEEAKRTREILQESHGEGSHRSHTTNRESVTPPSQRGEDVKPYDGV